MRNKLPGTTLINKHLKNIFNAGELEEDSVISILEIEKNSRDKVKGTGKWQINYPIS